MLPVSCRTEMPARAGLTEAITSRCPRRASQGPREPRLVEARFQNESQLTRELSLGLLSVSLDFFFFSYLQMLSFCLDSRLVRAMAGNLVVWSI